MPNSNVNSPDPRAPGDTPNTDSGNTSPDTGSGSTDGSTDGSTGGSTPSSQSEILRNSVTDIQCKILDNNFKITLLSLILAKNFTPQNQASLKQAQADSFTLQKELVNTTTQMIQAQNAEITKIYSDQNEKTINDYNTYQQKVGSLLNDPKGLTSYIQSFVKTQAQSNLDFANKVRDYWLNNSASIQKSVVTINDEQLKLMNYYPSALSGILSGQITDEAGLNDQIFGDPTLVSNLTIDGKNVSLLAPLSKSDAAKLTVDKNGIVHDANGDIVAATVSTTTDGTTSESITVGPIDGKPLNDNNYLLTKVTPTSKTVIENINGLTITKDITPDKPATVQVNGTPDVDTITVGGVNADMSASNLENASFTNVEKLVVAQSTTMQAPTVMDFSDGIEINPGVTLNLINFTPVADLSKISGNELDSNLLTDTNVTLSQASDKVIVTAGKIDLESFDKVHDKIHFTNGTSQAVKGKLALQSGDDKAATFAAPEEAPTINVNIDASGVVTSDTLQGKALADALYGAANFSGYAMVKDGTLGAYIVSKTLTKEDKPAAKAAASDKDEASDAAIVHIIGVNPDGLQLDNIVY